jgi:hypothetical protein
MRGSHASRTAARTPSDSVFSVVILNSRTCCSCDSEREGTRLRAVLAAGDPLVVAEPFQCHCVSTAPLASASTLNVGTLTDWANQRKFTLGLLRVNHVVLTMWRLLPVSPEERTSPDRSGWSGSCHNRTQVLLHRRLVQICVFGLHRVGAYAK